MKPGKTPCIVLIGMPGSGKSTVARALAQRCKYAWIDTDDVIEQTHLQTLQELIAAHGIEGFHELEEAACKTVNPSKYASGLVVSTGGSVVYQPGAMEHLGQVGTLVHLDVDASVLLKRLGSLAERGVTIAPGQTFADLFQERAKLYERYRHVQVRSSRLSVDETVDAVLSAVDAI